jgi:hypothetical protein
LLGNYYTLGKREKPTTAWGQAIFHLREFEAKWPLIKQPLLIVVKDKNLRRFEDNLGESPVKLATEDEYVLVFKR